MILKTVLAGVGPVLLFCAATSIALAQEAEIVSGGEIEYQSHCAVCHGQDGKGTGIMARDLTIRPSDLTQLRKKNGGEFPFWRVYGIIDGHEEMRGHGSRTMPVWGPRFQAEAEGTGPAARSLVTGRILGLVFYLRHIQEQ